MANDQKQTTKLVTRLRECAAQCDQPTSDLYALAADRLDHLRIVMMECCDSIRDQDDIGALRMLEVALNG